MEAIFYCSLVLGFAVLTLLSKNFFVNKRRRHLPPTGGIGLPVIGHLYLTKPPLHQTLAKLSARHGQILLLRFGSRPVVVVSSPELAAECLTGTNDVVFANRPPLLSCKHFGYNETTLVAASYGPHWRNLRRVAVHEVLSSARIDALSDVRADELRHQLRRLYKESSYYNSRVDMRTLFFELTMNTTMRMVSGKSFCGGGATAGATESQKFVKCIQDAFHISEASNLEDFLPLLRWVTKLESKMMTVAREVDALFQDMVDEHRHKMMDSPGDGDSAGDKLSKERKTVIDVMLELQRGQPDYYTDEIIKGMILIIVLGGTETSSGSMEWAMALLLNNPRVLEKAKQEIDIHVGQGRLVADHDLPNLQYLANIIRETLRLFPPGPFLLPHFSSDECVVGGFDIPRGTMLLINIYAIQRDPKIWENPNEFMPERFEDELLLEGYKSIPFGTGRRRCPGEILGTRMLMLTLANLIRCFEWGRIGEDDVDLTQEEGLTLTMANPLIAMFKPRPSMISVLSQL